MAFQMISPEIDPYMGAVIVIVIFGFIVYLVSHLSGRGSRGGQRGPPGPRGEHGERGEPGPPGGPAEEEVEEEAEGEAENLKELIEKLKGINQVEIKKTDEILTTLKSVIGLIEEYKDKPDAILLIKQRLEQLKPLVIYEEKLLQELLKILRKVEEFEKDELIKLNYQLGQVKKDLMLERGILSKKDKKAIGEKNKIRLYVEKIKEEALAEFKLTKKELKNGEIVLINFDKFFIALLNEGIVSLNQGDTATAKKNFEQSIEYIKQIKKVLEYMGKLDEIKRKILNHELKDFKREKHAANILKKIF